MLNQLFSDEPSLSCWVTKVINWTIKFLSSPFAFFDRTLRNLSIMPIFSLCICCTQTIFASSSFHFSSVYSSSNSIISLADNFKHHLFFFFFGGSRQLARGNSSSSSVEVSGFVEVAGFVVKEEMVTVGISFRSIPKNSSCSCWKSHSFWSLLVLLSCSLTFLFFSSSFFHLLGALFFCNFH